MGLRESENTTEIVLSPQGPTLKWSKRTMHRPASPVHIVASRVFELFAAHGVPRPRIPELRPACYEVCLSDCADEASLLPRLSGPLSDMLPSLAVPYKNRRVPATARRFPRAVAQWNLATALRTRLLPKRRLEAFQKLPLALFFSLYR
jgi:hypothetical protein